ncbi:DUF305 domain-containing protein [Sphingobium cloacae]|uniref:DUF305 domain-containing protein n=1 Tax=Sphingobium cloacae TaxID=120107 RepID=A0A1E1F4Y6_9SPHN|nr:DUF305 domain-containing protein [Sphingobium cloacae]BAV65585.1 hypothetical protein SCLO_1025450 [Sphingobium cloacae]
MGKTSLRVSLAGLLLIGGAACGGMSGAQVHASSDASAFLVENDAAMKKMMADMHVPPSGMVDRDFLVMMIPHHQGAIDMCAALLRYGSNAKLKILCNEIATKQEEEIHLMRRLLADMPAAPAPADENPPHHHH